MRELRKMKKQSSKYVRWRYTVLRTLTDAIVRSRRFKAAGSEYKWKQAENGKDLLVSGSSADVA